MKKSTLFLTVLVSAFCLSRSNVAFAQLDVDPVAYYPFIEDESDQSGNGYDALLIGDAYIDEALVLDGDGDAAKIPTIDESTNELTYAMWIYPTEDDLESKEFSGGINTDVWVDGATHFKLHYGKINIGIYNAAADVEPGADLGTVIPSEEWTHIAVTISESEVVLYVNGLLEATGVPPGNVLTLGDSHIGAWDNGGGGSIERTMAGSIKEVYLFNVALGEDDILEVMEPTTIKHALNDLELKFGSNPVKNVLNINNVADVHMIEIFDITGNLVSRIQNDNSAFISVSTDNMANGVYLVRAYTTKGVKSGRFVKE